jgi:DNA-binding NtrC family response regulator
MSRILVVDDNAALAQQYAYDLKRIGGHEVIGAANGGAALVHLEKDSFDCVILDLDMPGIDGFEVLRTLRHRGDETPVIVYTGTGSFDRCMEAIRLGASSFVDKNEPMERVSQDVNNAIERARLRREVTALQERLGDTVIVGGSRAIHRLREEIAKVANVRSTVLIVGESGTGKELVARELHRLSRNASEPLVCINCAALPEYLVESELFGHERGAFTGAASRRKGAFESAGNGTLFLDEVGELPLTIQPKFLRVLEGHVVSRVGANGEIPVRARVVAATNRDLEAMVKNKEFREDVYHRLNTIVLRTPPLRERREDIGLLAEKFVEVVCKDFGMLPKTLSPETKDWLVSQDFAKNNVRELRNAVERAVVYSTSDIIRLSDCQLPEEQAEASSASRSFHALRTAAERKIVVAALEKHGWHITKTAEALELADHASLLKIMRRLGIQRD